MARDDSPDSKSFFKFPSSLSRASFFPTLWEDMGDRMSQWMGSNTGITISEDKDNVCVEAHLPGLKDEDVDISLHQNTLVIQGEKKDEVEDKDKRFYRRAQRSFYYEAELPARVEENTEEVSYEDGVLRVNFKKTTQGNVRKLAVRRGTSHTKNSN